MPKPAAPKVIAPAAAADAARESLRACFDGLASAGTNLCEFLKLRYPQHRRKLKMAQAGIIALNTSDD